VDTHRRGARVLLLEGEAEVGLVAPREDSPDPLGRSLDDPRAGVGQRRLAERERYHSSIAGDGMKQVFLNASQVAEVMEVEAPSCGPREVLIGVRASLISTGTETAGYDGGGLVARGLREPGRIRAVWESARRDGLRSTIDRIKAKARELTPRGYSGSGVAVAVGAEVRDVAVGDRVAYAGAPHAEFVAVGENLVAPIPSEVTFEEAAFGGVACIALHGVRLAEVALGERVLVVGLGLVGLLAAQLAQASGATVIGVEPLRRRRELARELGIAPTLDPSEAEQWWQTVAFLTRGYGADAALLCAGVKDSAPTNEALAACRDRARVVMVGDMGLALSRRELFGKELLFRVSRSYGPGRYDPDYEARGLDYPIGYVRWTEGRNLACFLDLVAQRRVQVRPMVGKEFPLVQAPDAYRLLVDGPGSAVAVLLTSPEQTTRPSASSVRRRAVVGKTGRLRVGIIGCGSFVTQQLLPHFPELNAELYGAANRSSGRFPVLEARFHPAVLTTSVDQLVEDPAVDAFIVGTRHNLHAPLAERILRSGKPVHVEKPMGLTLPEAESLAATVQETNGLLTVGFNRRFAPLVDALRGALQDAPSPRQFLYRVNALPVPIDHWTLDPVEGGGRLVGEGCHFIDLVCYLAGAEVLEVSGALVGGANQLASPRDNFVATMRFANGDIGTVAYTGQGAGGASKERLEAFTSGRLFEIDDFDRLVVHGARAAPTPGHRDKGFRGELENFFEAVRGRATLRTTVEDGLRVARIVDTLLCQAKALPPG
jgi:predicted dehydrogenase/threonine dehydrogenase-like Zn-dependent dehydrogenase